MKRVLITGIKGFTGRHLAAELEAHGWEVWGCGRRPGSGEARYRQADLADGAALRRVLAEVRPHGVIHLAGLSFTACQDGDAYYRENLLGSRALLAALADAAAPECVILASSGQVYGPAEGCVAESAPLQPASDYALSKVAMEYLARLWMGRLPIVIARPFNCIGVGQRPDFLLPKIVSHCARRAECIELGNLDVWRDFSDVRAVAAAYRRLLACAPAGEVVNISSGRCHSLQEVLQLAGELAGHRPRVVVQPGLQRAGEPAMLCGDPSRLQALIGPWQPPPLADTLAWMLAAAGLPR